MVGMRVCRGWEELGMEGRTISGSVGAFFTHLNMSVSMYNVLYTELLCCIYTVYYGRSSSAIFLVEAVS